MHFSKVEDCFYFAYINYANYSANIIFFPFLFPSIPFCAGQAKVVSQISFWTQPYQPDPYSDGDSLASVLSLWPWIPPTWSLESSFIFLPVTLFEEQWNPIILYNDLWSSKWSWHLFSEFWRQTIFIFCGTKVITEFVLWPSFGPLLKPCNNLSKVAFKNERTTTGDKKKVSFHYTVGGAVFGPKNLIEKLG